MTSNDIYQRKAPFLHRNWLQGIANCADAMGNIVSGQLGGDAHNAAPTRKRRRISIPESPDADDLIDARSTLRIKILNICHMGSNITAPAPSHRTTTKANCRITISDLTEGRERLGRIASQKDDDGTFDLADTYELLIEFEAANGCSWPPLDSSDFGSIPALQDVGADDMRKIVLKSRFRDIFGTLRGPLVLSAGHRLKNPCSLTEYVMDVELRWSSGFRVRKHHGKGLMPCINAIDPDALRHSPPPMSDEESVSPNSIVGVNSSMQILCAGEEQKRRVDAGLSADEGRVTFIMPSGQSVQLYCNRCVVCGSHHETLMQLQMHLRLSHESWDTRCELKGQGPEIRLSASNVQIKPTKV
ncbi:hypothetical protein PWT90_09744 [Aphanocladium album]|nr:hypothetical protein PWT90_09744 [Aphanocladium album]